MSKTIFLGVFLIILGGTFAVSEAMDNAECSPVDGWTCQDHGPNTCKIAQSEDPNNNCGGSCDLCLGSANYPAKMCFYVENGAGCSPLANVACGVKLVTTCETRQIFTGENICACPTDTVPVANGVCTFASCN